jgi:hypothetical protein
MTANLSAAEKREALPKGTPIAHIHSCVAKAGKAPSKALYIDITWRIDEFPEAGPSAVGRDIRFDNVMYGGLGKTGDPINTDKFAQLLEAADIPWECEECHAGGMAPHEFTKGTGPDGNGLTKGKYYCPDCRQIMNVGFDPDLFIGRRCRIAIDIDDKGYNTVKAYGPIV